MRFGLRIPALVTLLLLATCVPGGRPDSEPQFDVEAGGPQQSCFEGRLASGPAPNPILFLEPDQGRLILEGSLRDELETLIEADLRVCGRYDEKGNPALLQVLSYTLLRINGVEAWVGRLRAVESGWVLAAERRLILHSVPPAMAQLAGEKFWVSGPLVADTVTVQTYGRISGR